MKAVVKHINGFLCAVIGFLIGLYGSTHGWSPTLTVLVAIGSGLVVTLSLLWIAEKVDARRRLFWEG